MEALRNKLISDKIRNIVNSSILTDISIISEANLFLEQTFNELDDKSYFTESKYFMINNTGFYISLKIDRELLTDEDGEEVTYSLFIKKSINQNYKSFKLSDAWEQGDNSSHLSNEMRDTLKNSLENIYMDDIIKWMLLPRCKNCNTHDKEEIGELCYHCNNMNEKLLSDLLNGKSVTNTCVCFDESDSMLTICMKCNYIMHDICRNRLRDISECPNCKQRVLLFPNESFKLLPDVAQMIKESNEPKLKESEAKRVIKKVTKKVVKH